MGFESRQSSFRTLLLILAPSWTLGTRPMWNQVEMEAQIWHLFWEVSNQELPNVQAGFRKGSGTRDQIANMRWIIEKAREFQKNIYLYFIDCAKALDYVDHDKLWKALREMRIPDHLTCLLRNLFVGQVAIVRTLYGTTDWFKIKKGVWQGCLVSP